MRIIRSSNGNSSISSDQIKTAQGLDYAIAGILALIFFLCPLFFTGFAAQGLGLEKMMIFYLLVLLGVVAWVTKGVITGDLELKRTPLDLPIGILLVIYTISTILSVDQKDSLIGSYGNTAKSLAAAITFIMFFYFLLNNINKKRIKLIFWSIISSSSLVIIYSLLQLKGIFILPMDFTKAVSFNPIGSLSSLTMYLIAVLPVLTIGMSQISEIHPNFQNKALILALKAFVGIMILGDMVILVLLSGFTFWPVLIVGIVIVLMFLLSKIIKITNNNIVIPIAVFLLSIIFLVLGNFSFAKLNLPAEVSLSKKASWEIAKSSIKHNPIIGSGPSTFYYSFGKFKSPDFNNTPLWNARFDGASGVLFELVSDIGVLGTLAFVVIILIAVSICFLTLIKTDKKEEQPILLGFFASFISIVLFSLLFTLSNAIILLFIILSCLALAVSIVIYPEKFKTINLSFRASAKYALALAAIFLCVSAGVVILFTFGLKFYLGDVYAMQSIKASDVNVKIEKLNKSIQLSPYIDNYYIELANQYMALTNQEVMNNANSGEVQNNLSLAIESGKKAVELSPNKSLNNESLALIYENASFYVRGALEWSENYYKKLAELEPASPVPSLRMALINMARANAETDEKEKSYYIGEAIKKFDESISKKSDLAAAYYGKGIAYEKLNQTDQAIDQLKQAVILANNNIDYHFELGRMYFNKGVIQPDIKQNASENIAMNDVNSENGQNGELSVEPSQPVAGVIARNDNINTSEQIFQSILQVVPSHANALYSLAVLYQKINEPDKVRENVKKLLEILPDDATKESVKNQFKGMY